VSLALASPRRARRALERLERLELELEEGSQGVEASPAVYRGSTREKNCELRDRAVIDVDPDDIRRLDPDRADVPPELVEAEGRRVTLRTPAGELLEGTLVVVPGTWGHARRIAGDDWPPPGPGAA
jgi:hypothetical protein